MKCCANCIGDRYLRREIIPLLSAENGTCSYCGSENELLINPSDFRDRFELLVGIYTLDGDGKPLVEWLNDDWDMLNHQKMDEGKTKELLAKILDDGDVTEALFAPSDPSSSGSLESWEAFRQELMYENRFFPKEAIDQERLEELLGYLLLDSDDLQAMWYRARIQKDFEVYQSNDMGAPPKQKTSHGRANPAGIPYLYLASNILTAISEIRPHTGEMVSVAEFLVPTDLKIVDLRHPRRTVSPFMLTDESEVALLRGDIGFLEHLGNELTRPVLPHTAAIDYTPSQYLCEFVKKCGYHGVMYRSSVGSGMNIALFNEKNAVVGNIAQHKVSCVSVELDGGN